MMCVSMSARLSIGLLLVITQSIAHSSDYSDTDKRAHFLGGHVIESVVYDATDSRVYSLGAACGAGVAKELYDRRDYGLFDEKDAVSTCVGGVIGSLINVTILEW
jgi:hypothetical protein